MAELDKDGRKQFNTYQIMKFVLQRKWNLLNMMDMDFAAPWAYSKCLISGGLETEDISKRGVGISRGRG